MIKIKDLMKKVVSTEKDITVKKAAQLMSKMHIGSLVMIKNNEVLGLLTEKDIINNISNLNKKISSVIKKKKKIISLDLNKDIEEAAQEMAHHKIKRLLVTENKQLVGIITATDIIANYDILNDDFF